MKISIITVCKNAEKTIEQTLLSVFNQTYKNIEYIIIDGASSDGTLGVIEKYKDRIACCISEPDTGIYNAMNKGIKQASGDILYFLNSNDTVYDEKVFEEIIRHYQNTLGLEIVCGNVQFVNKEKQNTRILKYDKFKSIRPYGYTNPCHQVMFFSAELFKKYGLYDESFVVFGDYDKNVEFLVKNRAKFKYIDRFIARFQDDGISSNPNGGMTELFKKERSLIIKRYGEFFERESVQSAYKFTKLMIKIFAKPYEHVKKKELWMSDFEPLLNLLYPQDMLNISK